MITNLCDLPNWEPVIYPNNSAILYGYVEINGVPINDDDMIGAFVGDECRGIGTISTHQNTAYVTLLMNVAESGELVTFKYYNLTFASPCF